MLRPPSLTDELAIEAVRPAPTPDAYGLAPDTPEPEIVAHLFRLYAEIAEGKKEKSLQGV